MHSNYSQSLCVQTGSHQARSDVSTSTHQLCPTEIPWKRLAHVRPLSLFSEQNLEPSHYRFLGLGSCTSEEASAHQPNPKKETEGWFVAFPQPSSIQGSSPHDARPNVSKPDDLQLRQSLLSHLIWLRQCPIALFSDLFISQPYQEHFNQILGSKVTSCLIPRRRRRSARKVEQKQVSQKRMLCGRQKGGAVAAEAAAASAAFVPFSDDVRRLAAAAGVTERSTRREDDNVLRRVQTEEAEGTYTYYLRHLSFRCLHCMPVSSVG